MYTKEYVHSWVKVGLKNCVIEYPRYLQIISHNKKMNAGLTRLLLNCLATESCEPWVWHLD